jgi:hypothetical protein
MLERAAFVPSFLSIDRLQQNLDITILFITILGGNNDFPSVLSDFSKASNDILFLTIIVMFCGPRVRIY